MSQPNSLSKYECLKDVCPHEAYVTVLSLGSKECLHLTIIWKMNIKFPRAGPTEHFCGAIVWEFIILKSQIKLL